MMNVTLGGRERLWCAKWCATQERKEDATNETPAGDGKGGAGVPAEAQDLTVFVQSVMEQMVREIRPTSNRGRPTCLGEPSARSTSFGVL